jgi:hypothetical protein
VRPPPTLCSCIEYEALAIAPQSQRHVCQILWLVRSLLPQSSRMSPFRRPVSAAKNSVPDSSFGDRFDDCVEGSQFGLDRLHHPVLPNRRFPCRLKRGRFCGDFRRYRSALFRSLVTLAVSQADFSLPSLQQKIPFPAAEFGAANDRGRLENLAFREAELPIRAASGITEDSVRGLRTADSILREHREVVRLRCRAANDPRPRPGRDPVRGTRGRSSC